MRKQLSSPYLKKKVTQAMQNRITARKLLMIGLGRRVTATKRVCLTPREKGRLN